MSGEAAAQGRAHFHNLQVAHLGIGGDLLLDDRAKRPADQNTKKCKEDRKWNSDDPAKGRFGASKHKPGKGSGKKYGGGIIGAAARMFGKIAFTRAQTS